MADELDYYIEDLQKRMLTAGFKFSKAEIQRMIPLIFSSVNFKNQTVIMTVKKNHKKRSYGEQLENILSVPRMNP